MSHEAAPVMYVPRMDAFLNHWFSDYGQARSWLDANGGYLFPYESHFFVTVRDAVGEAAESLGLST